MSKNTNSNTSKADGLLSLINEATQADLDELDAEIASLKNRCDALESLRKIIARKLGVLPPHPLSKEAKTSRKPKAAPTVAPASAPSSGGLMRDRVLESIAVDGPDTIPVLCKKLSVSYQSIHSAVESCEWFERDGGKVKLTNTGWQVAKDRRLGSVPAASAVA